MDVKMLNKWAELLLDMGKRNNLVNFKNAKMGTAEIVAPDFATIFHQAEHGTTFEVYDSHLEEDDDLEVVADDVVEEGIDEHGKGKDENKYTKEQYCSISAEKMGLFRLLTQQLGFSRMGDAILTKLESALKLLKNEIEVDGDMISLK